MEVRLDLAGYPLVLADTAGLRPPRGAVEAEGVRRARRRGEAADLRLVVIDAAEPQDPESLAAVILATMREHRPITVFASSLSRFLPAF